MLKIESLILVFSSELGSAWLIGPDGTSAGELGKVNTLPAAVLLADSYCDLHGLQRVSRWIQFGSAVSLPIMGPKRLPIPVSA